MAFIYDSQQNYERVMNLKNQLRQVQPPLDYPELVKLYRDRKTDPFAAIQWDRLPESEKRTAKYVNKAYSPPKKTKKAKSPADKAKKLLTKSQKKQLKNADKTQEQMRQAWLNSPNPVDREAARELWG